MDKKLKKVLKKLYQFSNRYYNQDGVVLYSTDILSDEEKEILQSHNWECNSVVHFKNHHDVLMKLLSLKENPKLCKNRVLDFFVAGVGGSFPRGLSALPAWHCLNGLPDHAYEEKAQYACCWVCGGEDKEHYEHDSYFQYCLYLGNSYSSNPMHAYLNLKHIVDIEDVQPSREDIKVLQSLFMLLRNAQENETPGMFEKRLTEAKLIKGDRYIKRGILQSLSLLWVIPNQFINVSCEKWVNWGEITSFEKELRNTTGRSDMEMPWAGWNGALKVDEKRIDEIFGDYFK